MATHSPLQVVLWRAACRHIDIADSLADLLHAIRLAVPVEAMWVFAIEGPRVRLVAGNSRAGDRFMISGDDAARAIRLATKGGLVLLDTDRAGKSLGRALAPALAPGSVVLCGLSREGRPEGIVAWRIDTACTLSAKVTGVLAATVEPLAAALETSRRFHELEHLRRAAEADRQSALRRLGRESLSDPIIGAGAGLRAVMARVAMVAPQAVPVLILGETGSGKEVIARAIHEGSARRDGPFIRVNCGAIPPELIDSQLFGHERGAFTGATDKRLGWFERADGGTLFLDEIGELPLAAQVRLLRVVQEGILERVGGQQPLHVDCRIVAATHRDLSEMVRSRTFREDLWYRIAVFPIMLPPLRERPEDLPALVRHFTSRASTRFGLPEFTVTDEDIALLSGYPWPGNIRELAAVIDRAALLGAGHRLALDAAIGSTAPGAPPAGPPAVRTSAVAVAPLDDSIRAAISAAIGHTRGRIDGPDGAAALLDINPSTLRSKMRKLGIPRRPHAAPPPDREP